MLDELQVIKDGDVMHRGTTPSFTFGLQFDTSCIEKLNIAFSQVGEVLVLRTIESPDLILKDNLITVTLTQEETILFDCKQNAEIQLRIKIGDSVVASDIIRVDVRRILEEEIL